MDWKLKTSLYNILDKLPNGIASSLQYLLQTRLGQLLDCNPTQEVKTSVSIAASAVEHGQQINSGSIVEIGTGRRINLPISFWLLGISSILTVDLNPYLQWELIDKDLDFIKANSEQIKTIFPLEFRPQDFEWRFEKLLSIKSSKQELTEILNLNYFAPGNASNLPLDSDSVDLHISKSVLEHIPRETLTNILKEGKRVLKPSGLFIHQIHLGDHMANFDKSISSINFLQYDEKTWNRLAGNRFMYHNRLRLQEYIDIFVDAGLEIVSIKNRHIDPKALSLLQTEFAIDKRFQKFDREMNATSFAQIIAR